MTRNALLTVLGVVLMLAAGILLVADRAPADTGEVALDGGSTPLDAPTAAAPSPAPAPPSPSASPSTATRPGLPTPDGPSDGTAAAEPPEDAAATAPEPAPTPVVDVGARPARIADFDAPGEAVAPRRIRLPSLDLDLPVIPVGVAGDGQMAIPEDVDEAGWYRHGPSPGEPGNAVIAGHVDDREQGLGAFRRLGDLEVDDVVVVESADGSTARWRVSGRKTIDKQALEADDLFRRSGRPQLVLVTCGGEFDANVRSYRSNVVVVADLL